jgi:hypothetical protein
MVDLSEGQLTADGKKAFITVKIVLLLVPKYVV